MDKSAILKGIADNPALIDELKKLFMEEFESDPIEVDFSNERLGELVKARLMGKRAVEAVFSKIMENKTLQPKMEGKHPGR
jgi:hypothetical protein